MKKIFFLLSLFPLLTVASEINCMTKKNLDLISEKKLEVSIGEKKVVTEIDEFRVYINNIDDKVFEIEVLDRATPSRQYSKGLADKLQWTLWSRQVILEVECTAIADE